MENVKITAAAIIDARSRTKSHPEKISKSDMVQIAGWCYWLKKTAAFKEFAYTVLTGCSKDYLVNLCKKLDISFNKSDTKEALVKLLKRINVSTLRESLVLPANGIAVPTFESLFNISTANRRRLQAEKNMLPISGWGSSKYGDYPIFGLAETIELLYACKPAFEEFKNFVIEELTEEAIAEKKQRERELAAKPQFESWVEVHKTEDPELTQVIAEIIKSVSGLVKSSKFHTARCNAENQLQRYYSQQRFKKSQQEQAERVRMQNEMKRLESQQQHQAQLKKHKEIKEKYLPELLKVLNSGTGEIFKKTNAGAHGSNGPYTYEEAILKNSKALQVCQMILSDKFGIAEGQKRFKYLRQADVEAYEDAIFGDPQMLALLDIEVDDVA
jgi:hypothetical protein